jgi:hypothetical protein
MMMPAIFRTGIKSIPMTISLLIFLLAHSVKVPLSQTPYITGHIGETGGVLIKLLLMWIHEIKAGLNDFNVLQCSAPP